VPAVAVNVPVVCPDGTFTVPGIASSPVLLEIVTAAPPVPATLESVSVHVELIPVLRLAGVQESSVIAG